MVMQTKLVLDRNITHFLSSAQRLHIHEITPPRWQRNALDWFALFRCMLLFGIILRFLNKSVFQNWNGMVYLSLQTSFNLPIAVTFDPYTPRISLDSKKVLATEAFANMLKKNLTELLEQPVEARFKPREYPSVFIKSNTYALKCIEEVNCVPFYFSR